MSEYYRVGWWDTLSLVVGITAFLVVAYGMGFRDAKRKHECFQLHPAIALAKAVDEVRIVSLPYTCPYHDGKCAIEPEGKFGSFYHRMKTEEELAQ